MNKAQIAFEKCKRIAKDNTNCLSILLKLLDLDREDILDEISEVNKVQYDAITPQGIVSMYQSVGQDIDKFIAKYDKAMESASYIRKNFYNGYQKGMEDYINNK